TFASPYWLALEDSSPAGKTARSYGAVYGLGIELFGLHTPFHKDDLTSQARLLKSAVARELGELQQAGLADMRWGKRGRALWSLLTKPLSAGLRPARDLPPPEDLWRADGKPRLRGSAEPHPVAPLHPTAAAPRGVRAHPNVATSTA